ncbi:hypothetical protein KCP69_03860 [Salmonella enterica subsp. enterica]|nr:hypothetical protein KCP69_03860 [Salmonella enterica subsp. enterica]
MIRLRQYRLSSAHHRTDVSPDDKRLRRAGLDYHDLRRGSAPSRCAFVAAENPQRLLVLTTKGTPAHSAVSYQDGDYLMFARKRAACPPAFSMQRPEQKICIPMMPDSRSMNPSNAVSVVVYEAWRQLDNIPARYCGRIIFTPDGG